MRWEAYLDFAVGQVGAHVSDVFATFSINNFLKQSGCC